MNIICIARSCIPMKKESQLKRQFDQWSNEFLGSLSSSLRLATRHRNLAAVAGAQCSWVLLGSAGCWVLGAGALVATRSPSTYPTCIYIHNSNSNSINTQQASEEEEEEVEEDEDEDEDEERGGSGRGGQKILEEVGEVGGGGGWSRMMLRDEEEDDDADEEEEEK
ncbi:hypothetical protein M0802_008515 [Mischocyttarus mexicanus]|nr:hypothetical protein M0802_008515 [Mischocyttarus mexicanus]